jgi:LEA14-like dessication related protein
MPPEKDIYISYFCSLMRQFLIALTAIILLASCGKIKKPEFIGVQDVKFNLNQIGSGKTHVIVYVKFFNPNSFTAKLKHADGEAWVDSTYIGPFVVDSSMSVAPKSEFVVPVDFSISLTDLALGSMNFLDKEGKEILIKVKGTIQAGRSGIYKKIPLNYEGKHDIEKLIAKKEK